MYIIIIIRKMTVSQSDDLCGGVSVAVQAENIRCDREPDKHCAREYMTEKRRRPG